MDIANSVTIKGDLEVIFRYASRVEDWPAILPHYRGVEVLEEGNSLKTKDTRHGRSRLVRMGCVRTFGPLRWPCKWTARQVVDEESRRVLFLHTSGPAKGMEVEWAFCEALEGVLTSIKHRRHSNNPLARFYFDRIVGVMFVSPIASKTLETIKEIVERETQK